MERGGVVYILTNFTHSVLYTGVTSDLLFRILEHRDKLFPESFTSKYNVSLLVYYCAYLSIEEAINEEKRIKAGSRRKKLALINSFNPRWEDLWEDVKSW